MRIHQSIANPPVPSEDWYARWEDSDRGLICSWLRGIEKSREDPSLAVKAKAGELPVLPWKGGVERAVKKTDKVGALQYLAMWQGLRGEDLDIELNAQVQITCARTGVPVTFTGVLEALLNSESEETP